MPPNRFESEVESFLEGSHGDRTHIKRADHPRLHHYAGHYWVLGCELLQTSSIQGVFRVDFCPVVTNVVNPRAFSLKMLVFGLRLTTFVTGVLAR